MTLYMAVRCCMTQQIVFFFSCIVVVRIKNMFLFDEQQAEKQFHYRTVMINWLFTPSMTYRDLAATSIKLWNRYLDYESVPGFGCKDPFESWGTWCVTRPEEGRRRMGSI